jgi:hypothetical protein
LVGVVGIYRSDGIDGIAGAIWGHEWSTIRCRDSEPSAKVLGEGLLVNHHADAAVGFSILFESLSEEEVGFSHEVDFEAVGEEALETLFFGAGFGEENEIVNVKANVDRFACRFGAESPVVVPEKRHGAWRLAVRSMSFKMPVTMLYQC